MNEKDLTDILFAAAERRARSSGVRFGQGADNSIHQFAQQGAQRILEQQPQVNRRDSIISQAESAFEKLVEEMVRASAEIEGYRLSNPNVIGEQTLTLALSRLCPCFPIC